MPGIDERTKTVMSIIFPNLATARASRNLCTFEYIPGGSGLNYHDTLWAPYHNYRIITYYLVMIFAFFFHLSIGMLFEKYGSVPEIIRNARVTLFGRGREEVQVLDNDKINPSIDPGNFEDDENLKEAYGEGKDDTLVI